MARRGIADVSPHSVVAALALAGTAMSGRRTTGRDLARLRTLAAAGLWQAEAGRRLGIPLHTVQYWHQREALGFRPHVPQDFRDRPMKPETRGAAIAAAWKLRDLMRSIAP